MDKSYGKLTVYFDDPFWVGVFERIDSRNKRKSIKDGSVPYELFESALPK